MAANLTAEERNEEWKLHFMLHVDTKKSKWKDIPLPFPVVGKQRPPVPGDVGGTKQLRKYFPGFRVSTNPQKAPKKSSES